MASRESLYDQAMNCIEQYARAEMKTSDGEVSGIISQLQDQMAYYCNSKARYLEVERVANDIMTKIQSATTPNEAKKICSQFETQIKAANAKKGTSDPRYQEFLTLCGEEEGDDELKMVQSSRNVIDPISKQRMVDPVKNSICGHTYEKSVVLQLIRKNPKTKCPIAGCSAHPFILQKHLVPDDELKRYLQMTDKSAVDDLEDSQLVSLDDTA